MDKENQCSDVVKRRKTTVLISPEILELEKKIIKDINNQRSNEDGVPERKYSLPEHLFQIKHKQKSSPRQHNSTKRKTLTKKGVTKKRLSLPSFSIPDNVKTSQDIPKRKKSIIQALNPIAFYKRKFSYARFDKVDFRPVIANLDMAFLVAGTGRYQLKILLGLLCLNMTTVMQYVIWQILDEPIQCKWKVDYWERALPAVALFLAYGITSPMWGSVADEYGRKAIFSISMIMMGYFGLLTSFSATFYWFISLRFITGMFLPTSFLALILLCEFIPVKNRVIFIYLYQVSTCLGSLFSIVLATIMLPLTNVQWYIFLNSLFVFLSLIVIKFLQESPEFLATIGKLADCGKIFKEIIQDNTLGSSEKFKISIEEENNDLNKQDLMFSKKTLFTTIHIWIIGLYIGVVYPTYVHKFTNLLRNSNQDCSSVSTNEDHCQCIEINAIFYAIPLVGHAAEIVGLFFSIIFYKLFGIKNALSLQMILVGCSNIFIWCSMAYKAVMVIFYLSSRALLYSAYSIVFIYLLEIYSPNIRAKGIAFYITFNQLGSIISVYIFNLECLFSSHYLHIIHGTVLIAIGISCIFLEKPDSDKFKKFVKRQIKQINTPDVDVHI